MEEEIKKENKILGFFRNFFRKNLAIKIISLVFALLIWTYVMAAQNPYRTKTVFDVAVSLDGEADLQARNLVVRGNRSDLLQNATVRVSTQMSNYADLDASNIRAYVSLGNVNTPGIKELPITATVASSWGNVESVIPGKMKVEIDTLSTKNVPVEVQYAGTLADNYWRNEPEIEQKSVQIRGAKQDVERITKAVCVIDLDGRTVSYNDAVKVILMDENGESIDPNLFLGDVPTVTVRMSVLPVKTVTLDVQTAIEGEENIPQNYSITSAVVKPDSVRIAGKQEVLDKIDALTLESVNVSGMTENVSEYLHVNVPDGVKLVEDIDTVQVLITIQEDKIEKTFEDVPIEFVGLAGGMSASSTVKETNVTIYGPLSIVSRIERKHIKAYIDVEGKRAGSYALDIDVSLSDEVQSRPETITSKDKQSIVVLTMR